MTSTPHTTHEAFIHGVRDLVVADALERGVIDDTQALALHHAKLVYGVGDGTYRGVCHYDAWDNGIGKVCVVEIAATAEESWIQLAGTVIHELGHIVAGWGAGHGKDWKDAAVALGFVKRPDAAGQVYRLALIRQALRLRIHALARHLADGSPSFQVARIPVVVVPKPCSAGVGTKGGRSRGKGSGSRLRLWECGCPKPVKVRVASDDFQATCDRCRQKFHNTALEAVA